MTDYIRVATLDQLPPGRGRPVFVAGKTIALFNVAGEIFALDDACPHAGSSLGMGKLDGAIVQCRGHGLRFDVRTGCMRGVDGLRVASYPVRMSGNEIAVAVEGSAGADAQAGAAEPQAMNNVEEERPQCKGGSSCTDI